jgi:hypothetical protein
VKKFKTAMPSSLVVVLLLIAENSPVALKLTAVMSVTSISSTTPALAESCPAAHMTTAARAKRQPEEEILPREKRLQSMEFVLRVTGGAWKGIAHGTHIRISKSRAEHS